MKSKRGLLLSFLSAIIVISINVFWYENNSSYYSYLFYPNSNNNNNNNSSEGFISPPSFATSYSCDFVRRSLNNTKEVLILGPIEWWATFVSVEFSYLWNVLQSCYGWREFKLPLRQGGCDWGCFLYTLQKLNGGRLPDAMVFLEEFSYLYFLGPIPRTYTNMKIIFWADDLHHFSPQHRLVKQNTFAEADLNFLCYSDVFTYFYPEKANITRRVWLPHSASPLFELAFEASPINKVFLSGAISQYWYPYRHYVLENFIEKNDSRFTFHPHPGYSHRIENQTRDGTGATYANLLRSHRACFTDGSILNYTLAKLFEIPSTGCLLLVNSEMVPTLRHLGFEEDAHYKAYTKETISDLVDWVLSSQNVEAVDRIRQSGMNFVRNRHLTRHRAQMMYDITMRFLTSSTPLSFPDVPVEL